MTTPTIVDTAKIHGGSLGGDLTIAVPTGVQAGDKLYTLCGAASAGAVVSTPTGWSLHPSSISTQVPLFERTSPGGEPANYVFPVSGVSNSAGIMVAVRGVQDDEAVSSHAPASGAVTLPSVNALGADRLLLNLLIRVANTTWSEGTGMEIFDDTAPNSGYACAAGVAAVGPGPTGTRVWTPANSASGSIGYAVLLAPPTPSNAFLGLI